VHTGTFYYLFVCQLDRPPLLASFTAPLVLNEQYGVLWLCFMNLCRSNRKKWSQEISLRLCTAAEIISAVVRNLDNTKTAAYRVCIERW